MTIGRAIVALAFIVSAARAQQDQDVSFNSAAEKEFLDAVALFKKGNAAEAAALFDELHRLRPLHQRTTAAYLMLAKSWLELKKYEQCSLLLTEFLGRFPSSTYSDDAQYTLGLSRMMTGEFEEAGTDFLRALQGSEDQGLSRRSETLFEYLADERLTAQGLDRILRNPPGEPAKDLVSLKLAEKLEAGGDIPRAKQLLYGLAGSEKGNPYRQRARDLLDRLEQSAGLKIGVVLPLMEDAAANPVKSLASELLEGITFAVKEQSSRSRSGTPVTIEVRDSKRDSAAALAAVRQMAASPDVLGIIGPVFSNAVAACAPVAQASGIPMISPTATADGLASLGSDVYQLHPDWSTRGKAMARYAVNYLGFSTLAVLYSAELPESLAARSFIDEAGRLGARIVASESFPAGASDLRDQFFRMRRAAIAPVVHPAVTDSLHPPPAETDTISENTDIAVTAIQGIFAAVDNAEEIGIIGSQLSYFNVRAQILGNEEWYDLPQLDIHKQYVNGALFTSDFYADPADTAYARFEQGFYSSTGRRPSKYTLIGYDTMTMLLDRIADGAATRERLKASLDGLDRYPAIHTRVTLKGGRVNSNVHILKYSDGTVKNIVQLHVN